MNRTLLVMRALGWHGGTVHDLCRYLDIDVGLFLYGNPDSTRTGSAYNHGLFFNTCSMKHRLETLVPAWQGSVDFWLGVARSQEMVERGVSRNE